MSRKFLVDSQRYCDTIIGNLEMLKHREMRSRWMLWLWRCLMFPRD